MNNHVTFRGVLSRISLKPLSLWLFLLAMAMAEILLVYSVTWVGIVCLWILLIYTTIQPIFNSNANTRDLLLGLSLIPLIRIMSISLPVSKLPQVWWFPLIYFPLFVAAVVVMYVTGLKARDVGFTWKKIYIQIPAGIAVGISLGIIEYLILKPQAMTAAFTFQDSWLTATVLFMTTGVVEEIIFRGVLQKLAISWMGFAALVYISIIFAIMHFGFYSSWDLLFVFLVAMLFAIVIMKTGSIWGIIFAHGTNNIILFTVAPFLLS